MTVLENTAGNVGVKLIHVFQRDRRVSKEKPKRKKRKKKEAEKDSKSQRGRR